MRLSTARERNDARSLAVIHAALDAGVRLLDTSDAYCHDEKDAGHNERLIAEALRSWPGDRASVTVATKGGLLRTRGAWISNGKAKHLRAACESSCRNLGVSTLDLYQLHAVDPATPLETSVRALASLRDAGLVRQVGLCNVTVSQIAAARTIVDLAAVQVSWSPFDDENLRNGVAEYCRSHGIRLLAWRPLGGERASRLGRNPVVSAVATESGATPAEVVLAWLSSFGADVVPLAGATRVETAQSTGQAASLQLDAAQLARLDEQFNGRLLRVPRDARRAPDDGDGDVVVLMGLPGAGKTTAVRDFEASGYRRLNRDLEGGSLRELVSDLDAGLQSGHRHWVLDNTYGARSARNDVIECAWRHGVPARCVWLSTSLADAQINAITRLLELHGSLPAPEELRAKGRTDPRYLGPDALFRYERTVEAPVPDEGFVSVERRSFTRQPRLGASARAILLECDDVVWEGSPLRVEEVRLVPGVREHLVRLANEGWRLFAQAWRPQVTRGENAAADVRAALARLRDLVGPELHTAFCPHDAGPPVCWCRKPLPGLVLEFALPNGVALDQSLLVGRSPADRTMAAKLGVRFLDADEWASGRVGE